jgi:hypothetical protein
MTKKLTDAERLARLRKQGLADMKRYRQRQRECPESIRMLTTVPEGAYERVRLWASESASKGAIARRLGMDPKTFRALMERDPELKAAYEDGIEAEHQMLVNALKSQMLTSPVPAIFLLKTRHGYREGDQTELGNRVSVTFNLPGAMTLDAFRKGTVIEHDAGGNGHDDPDA